MEELPFVQYNTSLKGYAKKNRRQRNMTKAERTLWNMVLKENKTGYRFLRQKIIKSFILDFYCSKLLLGIEVDGNSHDNKQEYDDTRTDILSERGIKILRYTNNDVNKNLEGVIMDLKYILKKRELLLRMQQLL